MQSVSTNNLPHPETLKTISSMRFAVAHLEEKIKTPEDYGRVKNIYDNIQTLKISAKEKVQPSVATRFMNRFR